VKSKSRWVEPLAAAVVGILLVGVVATVWEIAGRYSGGPVRFVVASGLVGLMAYVLHMKPAVKP
jgi:hypothetical protein